MHTTYASFSTINLGHFSAFERKCTPYKNKCTLYPIRKRTPSISIESYHFEPCDLSIAIHYNPKDYTYVPSIRTTCIYYVYDPIIELELQQMEYDLSSSLHASLLGSQC